MHNAGLTLSKEKCHIQKSSVQFLCQMIDDQGVRPDPAKVEAIQQFKQPITVKELCRFLGMPNHLNKFIPNLAETAKSLRDLLSGKNHWTWNEAQQTALRKLNNP